MPTPLVIDLSHHNVIPKDLLPAREAGIIGVIHKMTEGTGYVDESAKARHHLAKEAGLAFGLYHFLRPGDMAEQAEHFLKSAIELGVFDADTLLAADHEDPDVTLEDLMEFVTAVEEIASRSCVIYSGHVLKEQLKYEPDLDFSDYRLWLAQYADKPTLPPGFDTCWLWQYTDEGEVPGIEPPVDLNASDLTPEALLETWSGVMPTPPLPEEKVYTTTIRITSASPIDVLVEHGVLQLGRRQ